MHFVLLMLDCCAVPLLVRSVMRAVARLRRGKARGLHPVQGLCGRHQSS